MTTLSTSAKEGNLQLERSLDRLLASVFPEAVQEGNRAVRHAIHQVRQQRRAGNLEGALARLSSLDLSGAPVDLVCWAYGEWLHLVRRLYPSEALLLYRPATGKAALLEPGSDPSTLRVVATLGLTWQQGKLLSRRCLRGLKLLHTAGPQGGAPCQA